MQCLHDKRKRKWPCWSGQHGTGNDLVEEVNMEPEMTLVKSSTWNRKWPCWRGQHITGNDLVEEVNMEPEKTLLKRSTWNRKWPCWRGQHGTGNDLVEEVNMEPEITLLKRSICPLTCWKVQWISCFFPTFDSSRYSLNTLHRPPWVNSGSLRTFYDPGQDDQSRVARFFLTQYTKTGVNVPNKLEIYKWP
jgi:hypothetical protein